MAFNGGTAYRRTQDSERKLLASHGGSTHGRPGTQGSSSQEHKFHDASIMLYLVCCNTEIHEGLPFHCWGSQAQAKAKAS